MGGVKATRIERIDVLISDKNQRDKLADENRGLVGMVAKKYLDCGLEYEDIIGYGNIGLVKAINQFDESKGFKFSTFAVRCIETQIMQAIRDSRWKRLKTVSSETVTVTNAKGSELTISDFLADERAEFADRKADIGAVRDAINELDDKESFVICSLYEMGMQKQSQQSLAKMLNTTQTQVSRINTKAINKMRNVLIEWGCI